MNLIDLIRQAAAQRLAPASPATPMTGLPGPETRRSPMRNLARTLKRKNGARQYRRALKAARRAQPVQEV